MHSPPPPELRFLKLLVGGLAVAMIGGILSIVALLALRLPSPPPPLPEAITLPDGAHPEAVTLGRDFVAVVTQTEILIFDRSGGQLRQRVPLLEAE